MNSLSSLGCLTRAGTVPYFCRSIRGAFSLIELMVAMAVFSLLCVLLFSVVTDATRLWRAQEAQEESFREARAALNFLSRDLAGAKISTNQQWFYSSTNRFAFLTTLPSSSQLLNKDRSDICAVGYSLEWGKANPFDADEKERLSVYRYVRFSDPTHDSLILNPSAAIETVFDLPDGTNTVRELLARNIPSFSCDFYTTDTNGVPERHIPGDITPPDIFRISISVINEGTAAQLSEKAQWLNTNTPLIRQSERTFVLRVRPSQP